MDHGNLDAIFSPKSIAVVGASDRTGSVGAAVFANLRRAGFLGRVFPVNRRHDVVQGDRAYSSMRELPEVPDLAILCTAAETIPDLVQECGALGVRGLIVISAGFREAGAAGRDLEKKVQAVLEEFPSLRMLGPNCLGVVRPSRGMNASFSPVTPRAGRITLLTQSGALGTAIMDWASEREIGFATCVSVGNMLNVGMGELIDYFADDDQTEALLLYLEGLDDARHFVSAAQSCSRRKPVIAFKAGRFEESSRAAVSHTGAMATQDAVYDAAFRRAGIERVHSIEELFDCARLLAGKRHALEDRLAIVTNAGGPGIMASDAWLAWGGRLSTLSDATLAALDRSLPPCWSHGNPVDVLGDATVERFDTAIRSVVADPNVDAMMVIVTPQTMTDPDRIAHAVVAVQREAAKTVVASWIGGPAVDSGRKVLREGGVPVYPFPEGAAQALGHLVSAGRRQRAAESPSRKWGTESSHSVTPNRMISWRAKLAGRPGLLNEVLSKNLLAEYGVPIVPTRVAHSPEDAVILAQDLGYPVVLKVLSPDISHKTDVGGVMLNLADAERVRAAFVAIRESVRQRAPDARWDGVAVQPMISAARGVELLLGMKRDRQFGPVILLGAGGITAELQHDSVLELTPLDDVVWNRMLRSLRLYPLLEGYRGRPGVNLPLLREVTMRFVQMVHELPELATAEINPLLATPQEIIALDARLIACAHEHEGTNL
jgi:acetyltransferase